MAFESMLWNTTGTGHGPAGGYTQAQWIDYHRYLWTPDTEASAFVLPRKGNKLAVTAAASSVDVNTGAAFGYGFFFKNTASANLPITTPTLGTTGLIVVLRANWAAQTVTPEVVRNSNGVITIPTPTQTPNTTYECVLAEGTITNGGVVTLTDRRGYLSPAFEVIAAMIVDKAVTDAKLRDSAALSVIGRSANSLGVPADIAAGSDGFVLRRSGTTLGFGQIALGGIPDDLLTAAKMGIGAIKAGNRKGGDPNDWSLPGTVSYATDLIQYEFGVCTSTGSTLTVNFSVPFTNKPGVICSVMQGGGATPFIVACISASTTQAVFEMKKPDNSIASGIVFAFLAIGPA
jgi:hypothetical protein